MCAIMLVKYVMWPAAEYHKALLDSEPSSVEFITRFMQSEEPSFVHIALWILAQFSSGGKISLSFPSSLSLSLSPLSPSHYILSLSLSYSLTFLVHTTLDASAKAALRLPVLLDKVSSLRSSRNSLELTQLAETTLNNLKVSPDRYV